MMMEGGGGVGGGVTTLEAFFPVLFYDGERTVDMGFVAINPSMNFKGFQSVISQKIGISPHQITTYIERTLPSSPYLFPPGTRTGRRFPVTNKFNFAAAMCERNSAYFLVVSKKSRRVRRRRNNRQQQQTGSMYGGINNNHVMRSSAASLNHSPENFMLLRRDGNNYSFSDVSNPSVYFDQSSLSPRISTTGGENWYHHPMTDYLEYSTNLMSAVGRDREKFLMSLDLNSDVYSEVNVRSWLEKSVGGSSEKTTSDDGLSSWGGVSSSTGATSSQSSCEVCTAAAARMDGGGVVPFHCCKFDAVVAESFRSSAGPIARPSSIR